MRAFLKSSEGCFQLKQHTTTIGRHEASDIVLQSAGVADHHAALEFAASDNSFVLQDFNSPHGTFVNGCQVQNAAVRVSPGDILHFGGASFELVVDGTAQMSYPPVKRRTAWTGPPQLVVEPKPSAPPSPPHLPLLQWQQPPSSPGNWAPGAPGRVPHPPLRKRPVSARARSAATAVSPDACSGTSAGRPVSTGISGDGARTAPSPGTHNADFLPQEKGEKLLRLEKEIGRLSGLETESKQKDAAIRDLQDEIAAMAKTLARAAARNEVELTQKLLTFDRELGAKTEEIKALREQISNLQKGSSQVFSHSLSERDLEIGRLRKESEKLKRDHALAAGLVTSLQREVAGKEQKIQQLKEDVDKMKKENREKDNQLAVVSAKCSRIKEELKHELGEREVTACRNRIRQLERDLEGLQGEVQKYCAEQESVRKQLAEKAKAEEELQEGCARQALQLQEMGRRERLLRADVSRAKEQLESFKTRVMRACSPAAAAAVAGKAVTEQQVIEKVRQISDENQQSQEREKCLQEELSSRLSKEKEVSANVEVFRKSLQELQASLRSFCSSNSLRGELGRLEAACLDPSISAIAAAVVEMVHIPLSWLEGAERLLASVGMDPRPSGKGLLAALESLLENHQETARRNQLLQVQLERVQESQAALLREHAKELEATYEQDLQIKIEQIILEKDKENKEALESAVAKAEEKCKQAVAEEQKKVQDLESQLRSMTEAIARKSKEQEVADCKLREAVHKLEEAATQEMALRQRALMGEERLKAIQEENELERQKLQEAIVEYKEQSKQHSLTIVALEDRLLEAKQQKKTLEEENAALVGKMEGFRGDGRKPAVGAWLEVCPAAGSHSCLRELREELAAARSTLLSKEAVIARLTKELAETRARMSDMRGELSEEQKVELERNLSRLECQEREANLLREKLSRMSSLVEKKDRALKTAAEELRQARAQCQELKDACRETPEKSEDAPGTPVQAGEAFQRKWEELKAGCSSRWRDCRNRTSCTTAVADSVPAREAGCVGASGDSQPADEREEPAWDLADLGVKCRGLRHEETIRRQKEGLAELRERIKMLEKGQSSAATKKGSETLAVLLKDLPEKIVQKTVLEKEPAPAMGTKWKVGKVPGWVPNGGSHGATDGVASSEMADTTDLGEKMYLDVIGALGSLMKVKELSGMQSLKHLPQEEREKVGLQRRKDLELLYNQIRNLKSRLERKEEMLKDYEASMEQLRLSQASLRRCQEEMSKLEDEATREAEEKALLKEALERTQLQLNQEKKRLRAAKLRKPGAEKPHCSGKLKAKESTAEAVTTGSV
ncbi:LOW QUALITY PROTEIN: forkhead-associated domain-containing protein 1 [Accipiter gentilis]|uniref:LOW QUALITY PROTEIN: forkhead-associated domain-containing protein 1 n=1 Tax=Astur gentilis TaxID=8957 RepID=UPI00211095B1|nr:LOW QUALITY PROTEIN: forkhead-associated domain-containing protein 1 [Accipiter gentilis]